MKASQIDETLQKFYVDTKIIPGYQLKVYKKGRVVHSSKAGLMDLERNKPIVEDTIYRIYSMTKPITSVAAMMLVEECKMRLDDNVDKFIPSFKDLRVYLSETPSFFQAPQTTYVTKQVDRPMKVIDLLTHTSGLTYYFMRRTRVDLAYEQKKILMDLDEPGGMAAVIERLATIPLEFSPGTAWNYSVSIDVLGHIVELISGMRLGDFMRQRLFEPLGMKDTSFMCPESKVERFSSNYFPLPDGAGLLLIDDAKSSPYLDRRKIDMGGGGLVSTADDYLRFATMLVNKGTLEGVTILSPKTVALLSKNFLPGNKLITDLNLSPSSFNTATWNLGFSLGGAVDVEEGITGLPNSVGIYRWGGAAGTLFWIDPNEQLAVVFMAQVFGTEVTKLRPDIQTLVYSAFSDK